MRLVAPFSPPSVICNPIGAASFRFESRVFVGSGLAQELEHRAVLSAPSSFRVFVAYCINEHETPRGYRETHLQAVVEVVWCDDDRTSRGRDGQTSYRGRRAGNRNAWAKRGRARRAITLECRCYPGGSRNSTARKARRAAFPKAETTSCAGAGSTASGSRSSEGAWRHRVAAGQGCARSCRGTNFF